MKKLLFGILVMMLAFNSFAQDSEVVGESLRFKRYGIKTGLSLASFRNTHQLEIGLNDMYEKLPGFSGGYFMDAMGPSGHYSTQFGIQYTGMGAKVKGTDAQVRLHYVQMPLIFNARVGYKFVNAFFGGGIYGAGAFMGKLESVDLNTDEIVVDEQILALPGQEGEGEDMKEYSYLDAGLIVGGGLEFVLPNKHAVQLGFHVYRSFVPVSLATGVTSDDQGNPVTYNPRIQNRTFMISLSYLVKGK